MKGFSYWNIKKRKIKTGPMRFELMTTAYLLIKVSIIIRSAVLCLKWIKTEQLNTHTINFLSRLSHGPSAQLERSNGFLFSLLSFRILFISFYIFIGSIAPNNNFINILLNYPVLNNVDSNTRNLDSSNKPILYH